ncbi:Non-specific serine/threonine protein kinase [Bertholletia excelsa]
MYLPRTFLLLILVACVTTQVLLGCNDTCGSISIPYPFGTKKGCYIDEHFMVNCSDATVPPKLFLTTSTIEITNISLSGSLHVLSEASYDCYDQGVRRDYYGFWMTLEKFPISYTQNKFTAIGCDTYSLIQGDQGQEYTTGCISFCKRFTDLSNGSCFGVGCCQSSIPKNARSFTIGLNSYYNHTLVSEFNPCSYAFVAENDFYNFSSLDLKDFKNLDKIPVVLDWTIGNESCSEAKKNHTSFACKSNSKCLDSDNGPGYRCSCLDGYQGNPYLPGGCQDIDECVIMNPCNTTCHNIPGGYYCSCPQGFNGDGQKNGTGCSPITHHKKKLHLIHISLGISIFVSMILLGGIWLYATFRRNQISKLRRRYYEQNGGISLQDKFSRSKGSFQSAKIFSEEDLKKATNNFDQSNILGQGGQGTVYKGTLSDGTEVAIKKSKMVDPSQTKHFVSEVSVLSEVNHRNVVKLLGCCLEIELPLLVYEFVNNGTLYDHIHKRGQNACSMSWETRLKIAIEAAEALSYLHSSASTPIIHGDIKTANILLDGNYNAKVSDFGTSRLVPLDQAQLTTLIQGTFGYLDPEYFHSSHLTTKSDVYSFGIVLVELLTGMKALSFDRPDEQKCLASYFISTMNEGCLIEIVDEQVVKDAKVDQIKEYALLAKRCIRVASEKRPEMKEVATELQGLRRMEKHPWPNDNRSLEDKYHLLGEISEACASSPSGNIANAYDSMTNHLLSPFDDGR